ncbi:MAG: hypothetical protein JWQ11_1531 [Rhizobacter sp.]|nr:hypothetical protein [Rhizobacter sp.]
MNEFRFERAADAAAATRFAAASSLSRYLGGGTNLVDLMRENVEKPELVIDVTGLSRGIERQADGSLRIGAAATNSQVADHLAVRHAYPVLSRAILNGASGQIRNMATVGGNILQRTRCTYFYDDAARCNKRVPHSGCDAIGGINRIHAVLGTSASCVATHPSDMCVALAVLDAVVLLEGTAAARRVDFVDLHRLPGDTPHIETELATGELITAIELPASVAHARSAYRKVRDRASYAFAVISLAAVLELEDDGHTIRQARLALGGVAHKPWRATEAELLLKGAEATDANFKAAADAAMAGATPLPFNGFKIDLARRVVAHTLGQLASPDFDGDTASEVISEEA